MRTTFLHLPVELRHIIKDWLGSDLRTHVCFYLAHSSCSALYDNSTGTKDFWRNLCWDCGLGQLPDDDKEEELSDDEWRHIAIECIRLDGFCTLPHCGESLLEYNPHERECMHIIGGYFEDQRRASFDIHPALFHVDFLTANESDDRPVEEDADFRWHPNTATKSQTLEDVKERAYLGEHPLAARSFATATPIFNMILYNPVKESSTTDLSLDRPVTVFDVLSAIHTDLDTDLTMHDLCFHLVHSVTPHVKCVERAGWGLEETFENFHTLREALTLCPIKEARVEELTDYGAAVFIDLY